MKATVPMTIEEIKTPGPLIELLPPALPLTVTKLLRLTQKFCRAYTAKAGIKSRKDKAAPPLKSYIPVICR